MGGLRKTRAPVCRWQLWLIPLHVTVDGGIELDERYKVWNDV